MDSFYDGPRQPPVPTAINRVNREPTVPEVSVMDNSFFAAPRRNLRPPSLFSGPTFAKQHPLNSTGILADPKKQVRFQSPVIKSRQEYSSPSTSVEKEHLTHNLNGKTFKQIYMANVPNRHLDLSVLESEEPKRTVPKENVDYRSTAQYDSLQESFSSLLIKKQKETPTNNKMSTYSRDCSRPSTPPSYTRMEFVAPYSPPKCLRSIENQPPPQETSQALATTTDDPTIKDLFKLIQQQNEQIMLLQKQVNSLKSNTHHPQIESAPYGVCGASPFHSSPTKKHPTKFSIDLKATSFEVSFRPQNKFRKTTDMFEPKIREIIENDVTNPNEESLRLEESVNVRDSYMSAVPSIEINMEDYHSEDDDEDTVNVGVTFYKDLMNQVNNALKKMQSECQSDTNCNKRKKALFSAQTMTAVKQATLQHLKSIGVNLPPIEEATELTGSQQCDKSEVSLAVKQLLMKYLPDDKLAKAVHRKNAVKEAKPPPKGSEFSFATVQYLKKYNIIENSLVPSKRDNAKENNPKILDVTALKLQPKLL